MRITAQMAYNYQEALEKAKVEEVSLQDQERGACGDGRVPEVQADQARA